MGVPKLKSADEVMQNILSLCSPANIKALTRKMAREAFFGDQVLLVSTITGKAGIPLNEHKLDTLQTVLTNPPASNYTGPAGAAMATLDRYQLERHFLTIA